VSRKPVLVAEKQSSGQLVCTYANEAFANLFQFTSVPRPLP
jgi:hypothetical protein